MVRDEAERNHDDRLFPCTAELVQYGLQRGAQPRIFRPARTLVAEPRPDWRELFEDRHHGLLQFSLVRIPFLHDLPREAVSREQDTGVATSLRGKPLECFTRFPRVRIDEFGAVVPALNPRYVH